MTSLSSHPRVFASEACCVPHFPPLLHYSMAASEAVVGNARSQAASAALTSLAPLLAAYHTGVDEVLASQEALQGKLRALLDGE